MESNKVLRFQVAIQDNATKGLEEIEKKFLGLSNQAVTVVGNINNELKKIGGISFNMPDLSKMIGQLNNLQDTVSKRMLEIFLYSRILWSKCNSFKTLLAKTL